MLQPILVPTVRAMLPPVEEMYQALVAKDPSYEGVFLAAIKTTGIFCRSICHARKPKRENVEYYSCCSDALNHGYRPCKVCKPLEPLGSTPDWINQLLLQITKERLYRLKDADLREMGIEPTKLRRWFKKHHGMTFQAYLRALRLNQAFGKIRQQTSVTETAMESGYDSLSGFGEAFKKLIGVSPNQAKGQKVITLSRILTPLGPMIAGATDNGICLLEFVDRRMLETQLKRLTRRLNASFTVGEHSAFDSLSEQLEQYFNGDRQKFKLVLDKQGTHFQDKVWSCLEQIPYGQTRSYQQQAENIGNPKAVRAVAKANGDNCLAILIPCHRVIGKNGSLTGYGGGLWRKKRLLEIEGIV
jgi:AraC family transcriptional regulator of adaptative response/methylated-DNA-[protein]-cysteine methyltransferase